MKSIRVLTLVIIILFLSSIIYSNTNDELHIIYNYNSKDKKVKVKFTIDEYGKVTYIKKDEKQKRE